MGLRRNRRMFALACLAACGCSAMREVPRGQYAAVGERSVVRVETNTGARHDLERVRIGPDSLIGLVRRDTELRFEEFDTVRLSLDDVVRMSTRGVDWYRTGLIAGLAAVAAVAIVISQSGSDDGVDDGGGGGRPPP